MSAGNSALGAELELLPSDLRAGEDFGYRIINSGSVELTCGSPYRLERETDSGWHPMNDGMAFRLMGFAVEPGAHRDFTARIAPDMPTGRYRISTSVTTDHGGGKTVLTTCFDVRNTD
jgi:hypothetical protein